MKKKIKKNKKMCKEVDESSEGDKKTTKTQPDQIPPTDSENKKQQTEKINEKPKESISENDEKTIKLPDHSCGFNGDPLKIESMDQLVDLELSDL